MKRSGLVNVLRILFVAITLCLVILSIFMQPQAEAGGDPLLTPNFLAFMVKDPTPIPTNTPTPTPTPTSTPIPTGWLTIVTENFEGNFPTGWQVFDDYSDSGGEGEYYWSKRNCRASQGGFSGWAVGGGANGSNLSCGSDYPNYAESWMVYGPFDLSGATQAELTFDLWLNSELNYDGVCRGASIDDANYYGTCTTGNSAGWIGRSLDLTNVPTLGNLAGEPQVWIAIIFGSDQTIRESEGAYVDNILLRRFVPAANSLTASDIEVMPDPATIHERTMYIRKAEVRYGLEQKSD